MTFFEPDGPAGWSSGSQPRSTPPRRRRDGLRNALTVVGSALGAAALIIVMLMVTTPGDSPLAAFGFLAPPSEEIVQLADDMHLTEEGRTIFYDTNPELLSGAGFRDRCDGVPEQTGDDADEYSTVGCYGGFDRIVVFQPADPRLAGSAVTTAAHELLHAAYERLNLTERTDIDQLTEAAVDAVPIGDPVHEQIAASVGDQPFNLGTERFAYLGTQIIDLAPKLETYYARFIADRLALVEIYAAQQALFQSIAVELDQDYAKLAELGRDYDAASSQAAAAQELRDRIEELNAEWNALAEALDPAGR
ncbi:hypothetical protein ACFSBZ_04860 [Amnibacterium flavum]|uniref:Uncharacterized protein n=1 Tax=Amnibacterium flavum TaxID=2173173 RepID=A0A2V1HNQ4_9MICO|nr:hypothetical protein [Amnibacterium flavum]PVZ94188.1 hypothetical protein DDQ50_10615 [Amnibacterium flavum]